MSEINGLLKTHGVSGKITAATYLECRNQRSNKFYLVAIVKGGDSSGELLKIYGPIGKPGKATATFMDSLGLVAEFNKVVNAKKGKGYKVIESQDGHMKSSDEPIQPEPTPEHELMVMCCLPRSIPVDDMARMIDEHESFGVYQEKYDGERRPIEVTANKEVIGYNRKGQEAPLFPDVKEQMASLPSGIYDTEDLGTQGVVVFDMVTEHLATPFRKRVEFLEDAAKAADGLSMVSVALPTVLSSGDELRDAVKASRSQGQEGIVVRFLTSPYEEGRATQTFKLKNIKSATARVASTSPTKRSVGLELLDFPGDWVPAGRVTIPANAEIPSKGELVEIEYLYATQDGKFFQPVYKGERTDLNDTEAHTGQLIYKDQADPEATEPNNEADSTGDPTVASISVGRRMFA